MRTLVWATTQFEGFHRWKSAPDSVAFLRDWHRHLFHVRLGVQVEKHDREVEFLTLKTQVDEHLAKYWKGQKFESSCEMIAADLLQRFQASFVEVSEDGENGARLEQPICLVPRSTCFCGIEAEGPHRGAVVLFVPGTVGPNRLSKLIDCGAVEKYHIQRIYYGAGNCRTLNHHTLLYLRDQLRLPTDVEGCELERWGDIFAQWDVGLTLISMDENPEKAHYKKRFENSLIIWEEINGPGVYVTSIWDPIFQGDFTVE